MPSERRGRSGVTLIEILVAMAILAIIAAVGLPNLFGALQRSRARGAADMLSTALRDSRARAIGSGWQYRVFGFNDASGTQPNQFRIEGRSSVAALWPDPNTPGPLTTATQRADVWFVLSREFKGIRLNVNDAGGCPDPLGGGANTFCVTYTPQGLLTTSYLGPGNALQVADASGNVAKSLTATVAGAVRVQ